METRHEAAENELQRRFGELYDKHLAAVYGFLSIRLGGNRAIAEDLTAETFTAALRQYQSGHADAVTLSWLRTVARRRLIDHWRRESVAADNIHRLGRESSRDAGAEIGERELVMAALGALSLDQRRALLLQQVDGHTVGEIADLIGRTPKATESLLGRAREAFRAAYERGVT